VLSLQCTHSDGASTAEASHVGEDLGDACGLCRLRRRVPSIKRLPDPQASYPRLRSAPRYGEADDGSVAGVESVEVLRDVQPRDFDELQVRLQGREELLTTRFPPVLLGLR
jgi:hypothetical protein